MLQSNPTKSGTGLEVWGDHTDMQSLHQTVHKIADKLQEYDPKFKGPHGILMNFAFEVRKSFEGSRMEKSIDYEVGKSSLYVGFNYLWTDLLFVISVLRFNAGFVVMNELDQANLYLLEFNIKESLLEYDPIGAREIETFIGQQISGYDPLLFLMMQAIDLEYLSNKPSKKRFRNIPNLIRAYTRSYTDTYKLWKADLDKSAKEYSCDVTDIEYRDFPDTIW